MSLAKFRTYQLSVTFHRACRALPIPGYLKNQLLRASSSTSLNLAEGSCRAGERDRKRFYNIAFASHRECQAALDLAERVPVDLIKMADHLGACLYKLGRYSAEFLR